MIGALLLRLSLKPALERAFERRDVTALVDMWAADAVLEIGGTHNRAGRYVGKEEIRACYQRWFDGTTTLTVTVGRVAVTVPWALGLSNTLMYELHVEETSPEGVWARTDWLWVSEVRAAKVVHARAYPFDETPELLVWGRKTGAGLKGLDVLSPRQAPPGGGRAGPSKRGPGQ